MKPRYRLGERVRLLTPTVYREHTGEVVSIEKSFKECVNSTRFAADGLEIRESEIQIIRLSYEFDGETLVVDYQNELIGRKIYKFHSFSYTIKTPRTMTVYSERRLKKF